MLHVDIRHPSARDTVLFLHAGGFTGRMWDGVLDQFQDFRTIAVDLPGHGESRAAPFTTIESAADAAAETIRESLNGPAHVVGLSLGAYVGFSLAQRHPALVERAVLSGFQITRLKGAFWLGLFVNLLSPFAGSRYMRRKNERALGVPEDSPMSTWREPSPINAKTFRAVNRAALRFRVETKTLQKTATPILALAGAKEHPAILESLRLLDGEPPNGAARIAPGLGHAWPAQNPDLFVAATRAWIKGEDLPGALETV